MALNDIKFNRSKSGLGTPLPNKDHICGLISYESSLPSGIADNSTVKKLFSVQDAIDLGFSDSNNTKVMFYHIKEFFRLNPKGELYILIPTLEVAEPYAFNAIETIQDLAGGEIKNIGIHVPEACGTTSIANIQTRVNALNDRHKPIDNVFLAYDLTGNDLSALTDYSNGTLPNVSIILSQDGNARGKELYTEKGYSISDIGATLGLRSALKVHESFSYVEKSNLSDGVENEVPAFGNGVLVSTKTIANLNAYDNKRYLFNYKIVGISGTYKNDSYTLASQTLDNSVNEINCVQNKCIRNIRTNALPKLGSPLYVKQDGTLNADTIALFKTLAEKPLNDIKSAGEISDYQVTINPNQPVLTTSKIVITVKIIPVGVAREIEFNIGLTTKIS